MPAWAIRPVLPSGYLFAGQLVYPMTAVTIPNTLKKYVESIELIEANEYMNKYTGFESKKYRVENTAGTAINTSISIMLVGNLPRWMSDLFQSLARGCNGAGMHLEFYDDFATTGQYTGRWVNAADFVDNSEALCGGSIDIECFIAQPI